MASPNVSPPGAREKSSAHAFSAVELLIVISIVGALAAMALQYYQNYKFRAENSEAIKGIQALDTSIQIYRQINNTYPSSLTVIPQGNVLDPWGHTYEYLLIEGNTKAKGHERKDKSLVPINSDYDLYSMGADGKSVAPLTAAASQDDIVRANNGRYFGLASEY